MQETLFYVKRVSDEAQRKQWKYKEIEQIATLESAYNEPIHHLLPPQSQCARVPEYNPACQTTVRTSCKTSAQTECRVRQQLQAIRRVLHLKSRRNLPMLARSRRQS